MTRADPRHLKGTEVHATLNNMIKGKGREGWANTLQIFDELLSRRLEGEKGNKKVFNMEKDLTHFWAYTRQSEKHEICFL